MQYLPEVQLLFLCVHVYYLSFLVEICETVFGGPFLPKHTALGFQRHRNFLNVYCSLEQSSPLVHEIFIVAQAGTLIRVYSHESEHQILYVEKFKNFMPSIQNRCNEAASATTIFYRRKCTRS